MTLFLDAIFLGVRPQGPRRACSAPGASPRRESGSWSGVQLGMRESHEDWLGLARDLIARGLRAPLLIVADGAPGLIKAVEQCWPASTASTAPFTGRGT